MPPPPPPPLELTNTNIISLSQNGTKIIGCEQNLISSEGGQDTSARLISGHSSH